MCQAYVTKVYDAIIDWSDYIEWMQVVPADVRRQRADQLVQRFLDQERARKRGAEAAGSALSISDMLPPAHVKRMYLTDVAAQQREVLGGRPLNHFNASCLAWLLVDSAAAAQQGNARCRPWTTNDGAWEGHASLAARVDAIARVIRVSKQLLKSAMTLGEGWIYRLANNPCAELQGKLDNLRCNLRKNSRARGDGGRNGRRAKANEHAWDDDE